MASFFCVLVPVSFGASQVQKRLRSSIDDTQTFVVKGNTRPAVSMGFAQDMGALPASQVLARLTLHFALTPAQRVERDQLLAAQQNRRSPQYRHFLTPEEYADRFGLNTADVAKITTWLENAGFSNVEAARSRTAVSFSGSVARVEAAFHTSIHAYSLNGETHMANSSDPALPKALEGLVDSVGGLHNFLPKPYLVRSAALQPHYTTSSGTNYLVPDDWETIYDVKPLYSAGLDGSPVSGQTYSMVVVGQSNVQLSDLSAFRTAAGLPATAPTVMVVPGASDPGLQSASDQGESDLDLEWAGAIAKNANILFLTADLAHGGVQDAVTYAIDHQVAPILSISYGQCEQDLAAGEFTTFSDLFAEAAMQGMTIVAAAGDAGAAACDTGTVSTRGLAVSFPASSQYVTGIGGTEFNPGRLGSYFASSNNANGGSAQSYIPEIAWNDGNQAASGGGASTLVAKPSWQTGTGVPADGQRDVPDLAFTASEKSYGLVFCTNGSCTNGFLNGSSTLAITGGTSTGPPTFAGVLALLVQKTGSPVGLLNTNLYSLASISGNAFHDVTAGNNDVVCQGGSTSCPTSVTTAVGNIGYSAGVGYDQVTGLGSIDSYNFVEQWNGDIQLTAAPSSLAVQPGNSSNVTVTVTPVKNFTGPVTFACSVSSSIASIISCSVPSTPVTTSGSTTVTITAAASPASSFFPKRLPGGFPRVPPPNPAWLFVGVVLVAGTYAVRKYRAGDSGGVYRWAVAGFSILTLGAVSCGSGSSAGTLSLTCYLTQPYLSVPYTNASCIASGGNPPYTYSIQSGSGTLPPGLTISGSTGAISGTPTAVGVSTFTVSVTDSSSKTATQAQALNVEAAPVLNGLVTVTATSGAIVNTATIAVSTTL